MASPLRFIGAFLLSCTLACAPIAPESGPSCGTIFYSREIEVSWADTLDLVLVVDNTPGMERAQQTLMRTLPRVLEQLLTGDRDGDGVAEQAAIRSIHLGVITTDMGTGPGYANSFDGCHTPGGDDGLVGASINAAVAPSFLTFASTDATGGLAAQSQRALDVGTRGCVFRQPLEAALKAITSAEETDWYGEDNPRFRDPRTGARTDPGHASSAHAGFFRRDAALGIVVMTNGDDCSAGDERIFMDTPETNAEWGSDPRLRCTHAGDTLLALERYIQGFSRPSSWGFGIGFIVGLPVGSETHQLVDLSHPQLEVVETGSVANPIRDVCVSADGVFSADPPQRILTLHNALSGRAATSITSICDDDFGAAFGAIFQPASTGGGGGGGLCFPHSPGRDSRGLANCEVTETLPPESSAALGFVTRCDEVPGRTFLSRVTVNGQAHERCRVAQLTREQAEEIGIAGWVFEDDPNTSPRLQSICPQAPQSLRFTLRGIPANGSIVRIEYALPARSRFVGLNCTEVSAGAPCAVGMNCNPQRDQCNERRLPESPPLQCDAIERLCAVTCASDADCDAALLDGHVCDLRTYEEAATGDAYEGLTDAQRSEVRGVCVNPSCEL
jgi:hypothetical protein